MTQNLMKLKRKLPIISMENILLLAENQLKKLETFDSIYFGDKSHFEEDFRQNWLVFQTVN